uniref:Serpin domain-containing protein n=1 Tax=Xiphophorus couchianus TaxID=32473 RepID=A0A3B5KLW2_9TELE
WTSLSAAGGQENIIFSPLSVSVALGMVELGARGASLEEIREAVGFSHLLPGEINVPSITLNWLYLYICLMIWNKNNKTKTEGICRANGFSKHCVFLLLHSFL